MDQATAFGKANIIELGGKTYIVSILSLSDMAAVLAWAKSKLRPPMEVVKEMLAAMRPTTKAPIKPVAPKPVVNMTTAERIEWRKVTSIYEQQNEEYLIEQAEYHRTRELLLLDAKDDMNNPNSLDKKSANGLMRSFDGMKYMLWLSIRKSHPDVSFESIEKDLDALPLSSLEDFARAINRTDPELLEEMSAKKQQSKELAQ